MKMGGRRRRAWQQKEEWQQNATTSPIGQLASISDPIGSGSEKDGLFLEMICSCSGETYRSCDGYGPVSPSHFCRLVCVCVCAHTSVWEAAVFPFPPPPRGGLGMCGTERKTEKKEGWMHLDSFNITVVSLPFRRLIGGSTDWGQYKVSTPTWMFFRVSMFVWQLWTDVVD